ncbi:hypothetical protein SADUNF_Sadunf06G0064000 [Salix dunnii]|uniref:DUF4283 domain-containing protein n=1 Tax=Salix dunnii TaxID=1413687 RepID=A0A835K7Q7_9ROSI|nr:hypothetical protein SADUNF_Sadunf06G0064000 [Salix dunnii]
MVRFDIRADRTKVIDDGPWVILDHYLAARRLSADFNPATAKINKTMVWIRTPGPNIVFYNKDVAEHDLAKNCKTYSYGGGSGG